MYGCDPWKDKEDAIERRLDQLEGRNIDHDQALLDLQVEVDNDRAAMEAYASAMLTGDALNDVMLVVSDELETKIPISDKGVPEGVATLDVSGKVPSSQIPAVPVALQTFTNSALGGIKGSATEGKISANVDGTGSVNGWDTKANLSGAVFTGDIGVTRNAPLIKIKSLVESKTVGAPWTNQGIYFYDKDDNIIGKIFKNEGGGTTRRIHISPYTVDGNEPTYPYGLVVYANYSMVNKREQPTSNDVATYGQLLSAQSDTITTVANAYARADAVGVANGIASLDATGKVPTAQLPARGISDIIGLQTTLDGKQDTFSLYEHTIRVWTTAAPDKYRFSLTVLNQSPTEFTLPTLRDYLGASVGDYKQCSGMALTALSELIDLMGVRGGNTTELFFEGVDEATGAIVNLSLDWMLVEVLIADKVRQIV